MKKIKDSLVGYILILLATVVLVVVIKYLVITPTPKVKPSLAKKKNIFMLDEFNEKEKFEEKNIFTTKELVEKYPDTPFAEEFIKYQKMMGNIDIVTKIAEDYHKTHTYSFHDLFICGDMAIDVWNQIKTKGINAIIVVGNIDVQYASFEDVNHAWVLAEVEPFKWLAVETTAGRVFHEDKNYYRGFAGFNTPAEFKKYLELTKKYNSQRALLNTLSRYDATYYKEVLKLRDITNQIEGLCY